MSETGGAEVSSAPAAPAGSTRRQAVRASGWSLGAFAVGNLLRLASNIVLAYLFQDNKAALGLMVLVHTFSQGLRMFSDVGINLSVVQHRRGDDGAFVATAWTLQGLRGLVLWVAASALAWPYAALYHGQWSLLWLLPFVGVTLITAGVQSPGLLQAERRLEVGRVSVVEVGSQVAGLVVMITWAAISPTVWSLAVGTVCGGVAKLVLSYVVTPSPHARPMIDRDAARSLMRFGGWVFVSTALTFFASQAPQLYIGKVLGTETLAVFGVAIMLATFPAQALTRLAGQVVFPAYARVVNRGGDLGSVVQRVRLPVLTCAGLASGLTYACGPAAVGLIYPESFADAGWMLRLLAVGTLVQILGETSKAALLSWGRARSSAAGQGAKLAGLLVLLPAGYALEGMPGVVAGATLCELSRHIVFAVQAQGHGVPVLVDDLVALLRTGVSCLLGLWAGDGALWLAQQQGLPLWAGQVAQGAAGAAPVLVVWAGPMLRSVRAVRGRDG
jgi:O-antigen/teichoic acid export membrane protein